MAHTDLTALVLLLCVCMPTTDTKCFLDFVPFFVSARFLLCDLDSKEPTPCQEQKTGYSIAVEYCGSAERLAKFYYLKRCTFFSFFWGGWGKSHK